MFRLNFTMPMLERMTDGVIVLDRQAKILTNNRASEPWIASTKALEPALKRLIGEEVLGRIVMPVRIDFKRVSGNDRLPLADVWVSKNGRRDYLIFIAPLDRTHIVAAPKVSPELTTKRYASLFGDGVRQQLAQLSAMLQASEGNPSHDGLAIVKQAARVDQLLKHISDLTLLMQRDLVFADERICPAELLGELLPALRHTPLTSGTTLALSPTTGQQGVVYGSASWLRYALRVLVEGLIQGAANYSRISLETRQLGNFIVITGRVSGIHLHPIAKMHEATSAPESVSQAEDGAIRMLICQRIVELHAGHLKLELLASPAPEVAPGIESFTLTLATGLPLHERSRASCPDCRYVLQAQSYAADMAQVLSI